MSLDISLGLIAMLSFSFLLALASPSQHSTVLLRLPRSSSRGEALLEDRCLERAIECAGVNLFVDININDDSDDAALGSAPHASTSDEASRSIGSSCARISRLYSTAWDFCVAAGKPNLNVVLLDSAWTKSTSKTSPSEVGSPAKAVASELHKGPQSLPQPTLIMAEANDCADLRGASSEYTFEDLTPLFAAYRADVSDAVILDEAGVSASACPKLKRVAVGGTFDRLHCGHKKLLSIAAALSSKAVLVGLATDALTNHKRGASSIQPFEVRRDAVLRFMEMVKPDLHVDVVPLDDAIGPAGTDPTLDGLLVSSETLAGCKRINDARMERNLSPLTVVAIRRTQQASLSSTAIRNSR